MSEVFPAHLSPQSRAQFQEDTQVKYLPYYAYEEILATFGNRPGESESTSLLASAERLSAYLTDYLDGEVISRLEASEYLESRRQSVLALFEGQQVAADPTQLLILSADAAWAGLKPDDERIARRGLLRMVRLADIGEQGGDSRLLLRLSKFDRATETVLRNLASTPLVTIERDTEPGEALIQLASDDLLRHWSLMQSWIQEDREFLLWRQKLNVAIVEWRKLGEDNGALLGGAPLEQAKQWQAGRAEDLNENETDYINRCAAEEERRIREQEEIEKRHADEREELIKTGQQSRRRGRLRTATIAVVALLALSLAGGRLYQQQARRDKAIALTTEGNEQAKENGDRAIGKYTQAIGVDPSYAPAYSGRGRVYFDKGRYDEALINFKEAIKLDANNTSAYVGCGDIYWQKHDLSNAFDAYDRAQKIDPLLSEAYTGRGKVLAEQGKPGDAVKDYDRAIELSPKNPDAFLWRGEARSMSGDYDAALADFGQAIELKPDQSEAYIKRAEVSLKRGGPGDSQKAIVDVNTGLDRRRSQDAFYNPAPYFNRGWAYKNMGNIVEAKADLDRAVKLSQDKPEYSKINAEASAKLKDIQPKATPTPQVFSPQPDIANPTIYLYYRDSKDESTLKRIAAILKRGEKEWKYQLADKIELVPQATTGDVRYFHQEDEEVATKVKQIVENTLKFSRIEMTIELKPLFKLRNRPSQGLIEVWLPSLPSPSSRNQNPFYQQKSKAQAQ